MQTLNHVYFPSRVYIVGLCIGHVQKSITQTLKYVILGTYFYILRLVWNIHRQQIPPPPWTRVFARDYVSPH